MVSFKMYNHFNNDKDFMDIGKAFPILKLRSTWNIYCLYMFYPKFLAVVTFVELYVVIILSSVIQLNWKVRSAAPAIISAHKYWKKYTPWYFDEKSYLNKNGDNINTRKLLDYKIMYIP